MPDQFDGRCPKCRCRDFLLIPVYRWVADENGWREARGWPPPVRCAECLASVEVFADGTVGVVRALTTEDRAA